MNKTQLQTLSDLVSIAHDEYDGCSSYRDDLDTYDKLLADMKAEASVSHNAPGDAAAMREALDDAHRMIEAFLATVGDRGMRSEFIEMRHRIDAAPRRARPQLRQIQP